MTKYVSNCVEKVEINHKKVKYFEYDETDIFGINNTLKIIMVHSWQSRLNPKM